MIDTKNVTDRRTLRFENFMEVLTDAELLAEAERQGTLRATGNWTLGQAIGHLAFWARAPLDGYPNLPRPPWVIRVLMPLFKKNFLNKGLPAGVRIKGVPDGTYGIEPMATEEAIAQLLPAYDRLVREKPPSLNPVIGRMTHEEYIKLNLRHAELHLSFFHPQ